MNQVHIVGVDDPRTDLMEMPTRGVIAGALEDRPQRQVVTVARAESDTLRNRHSIFTSEGVEIDGEAVRDLSRVRTFQSRGLRRCP